MLLLLLLLFHQQLHLALVLVSLLPLQPQHVQFQICNRPSLIMFSTISRLSHFIMLITFNGSPADQIIVIIISFLLRPCSRLRFARR